MMDIEIATEPELPFAGEGWWDAVMAEDGNLHLHADHKNRPETQKAIAKVDWKLAVQCFDNDEIIALTVVGYNKGGLLVESKDLAGFLPCSHLINYANHKENDNREECLAKYLGATISLKIIECVPEEGRLVFSERAARAAAGKRTEILTSIRAGNKLAGEVTNVTDFGVFVDLGGVEGLVHISELSWGRVTHPGKILQVGEQVEVVVMDVDPAKGRVALSLKRLGDNPWISAEDRYPVNTIVPATITTLVPFGAFAKLEEGLEGLIHSSEMDIPTGMNVDETLAPGQIVNVRILQVDAARQRLGLSLKKLE